MVEVDGKHFYIFEPTTLKTQIFHPVTAQYYKVVIPIYFFVFENEIYAKCVAPKARPNQNVANGFSLFIPADIPYTSPHSFSIKTSTFGLKYEEMIMSDGSKYSHACNNEIFGQLF